MGSDKESDRQHEQSPGRSRHEDRRAHKRKISRESSPHQKRYRKSSSSSHKGRESSRSRSPSEKHRSRKSHRSTSRKNRSKSRSPFTYQQDPKDREDPNVCHCLGVFGLSSYTQEKDLKDVFGAYGHIDDICIIYDRQSGHSKGFGFVYFRSTSDAIQARKGTQGLVLDRRPIRVDYSFTLRPHSPTPGRYLGRRSGRDLDKFYNDSGDYDDRSLYRENSRRSSYRDRHYRDYNDNYFDDYDDDYARHSRRFSPYSRRH